MLPDQTAAPASWPARRTAGDPAHVVVVGAGITGLTAAWTLRQAPQPPQVTLLEATARTGGKIRTGELAGVPVEAGPDTFLARQPWATELCRRLGLGDDLVAPATGKAFLWSRGRLRNLPAGLVLGVPTRLTPVGRSGLVSPAGVARAAADYVLPRRPLPPDPTIAQAVGSRLGHEVVDNLVEPLLGGINAGRAERLSLAAAAPDVAAVHTGCRSLLLGLRRHGRNPSTASAGGPIFLGVTGGLQQLIQRLQTELEDIADLRTETEVRSLYHQPDGGLVLDCSPNVSLAADAVVLAVPTYVAASILKTACPRAANELASIDYASVSIVTLGYRPDSVVAPLDGSGFLVPRAEDRLLTACTWLTSKWPALQQSGLVLLRGSVGRIEDERASELDDEELVDEVHAELVEAIGVTAPPVVSTVTRWPRSFPQYDSGHNARVARAETALASLPGVILAGAAYRGLGIAACVRQGQEAAGRALIASRPS